MKAITTLYRSVCADLLALCPLAIDTVEGSRYDVQCYTA